MIFLDNVYDTPTLNGTVRPVALDVTLAIPPGRYAFLAKTPELRRPALDLLAGLRPPLRGRVFCAGAASWPIGRPGIVRGKLTGYQIIALIARLYDLDQGMCCWVMEEMLTNPRALLERVEHWNASERWEFTYGLALLPRFDVYFIDGALPFRNERFTTLWHNLFEDRLAGRMLILSVVRVSEAQEYCDAALVLHHGRISIESNLEHSLADYPIRPPTPGAALPAETPDVIIEGEL